MRLTLVVTLLLAGCTARPRDPMAAAACAWTARDSIHLGRGYAYLESPRAAVLGEAAALISHQAIERTLSGKVTPRSRTGFLLAGIQVDEGTRARPIELPPGVTRLNRPRVVATDSTTVEMVWQGGYTLDDTVVSRLWTATLDRDNWSSPTRVGDWLVHDLGITTSSDLVARGNDLALVAVEPDGAASMYLRVSGAWRRHSLPGSIRYASLGLFQDRLALVTVDLEGLGFRFVGFDGSPDSRIAIASEAGARFHYPVLLSSGSGTLTVVWVESVGEGRSTVRLARSGADGRTWTEAANLVVEGGLESFDAVQADGEVVVAGRRSSEAGPWPFVAAFGSETWRILPIPRLPRELGIVPPRFSRRPGPAEVLWGVITVKGLDSEPPMLARVRARTDCPRHGDRHPLSR